MADSSFPDRGGGCFMNRMKRTAYALLLSFLCAFALCSCSLSVWQDADVSRYHFEEDSTQELYKTLNDNQPEFTEKEKKNTKAFETYSRLDRLGRCGVAYANICKKIMPTGKREEIGQVKPSGWHTVKYDIVEGKYLYNRCHLIGYQLAGENANEKNLITGTRYFNAVGMLEYENLVADYVKDTGHHVLYRVTPVFEGKNLVATGVLMEAYSVEDAGEGICFNVFVYNIQPGIAIDYATGESHLAKSGTTAGNAVKSTQKPKKKTEQFVINKNTRKFHKPDCSSVKDTIPQNRKKYSGSREELIKQGYEPCKKCNP